jgi:hypothetical protein
MHGSNTMKALWHISMQQGCIFHDTDVTSTCPDLAECAVYLRLLSAASELVSDVANGGQVLIDEPTFLLVKDSLSLLGTVSEAGYDDRMLQRLNQAKVVGRLQQQVACASCLDSW